MWNQSPNSTYILIFMCHALIFIFKILWINLPVENRQCWLCQGHTRQAAVCHHVYFCLNELHSHAFVWFEYRLLVNFHNRVRGFQLSKQTTKPTPIWWATVLTCHGLSYIYFLHLWQLITFFCMKQLSKWSLEQHL